MGLAGLFGHGSCPAKDIYTNCSRDMPMAWNLDQPYIREHLRAYTEFQVRQGYRLKDVRTVLLKYGYGRELVGEATAGIDEKKLVPGKKGDIKVLDEELYLYVQNLLVDYIRREQEQGYTIDVIRRALINYGHHPDMVRKAIRAVEAGHVIDQQKRIVMPGGLVFFLAVSLIFVFVFAISAAAGAELSSVFLSFLPALGATVAAYAILENSDSKSLRKMTPLVSVLLCALFFVFLSQATRLVRGLSEPATVLMLNIGVAFVCSGALAVFSQKKKKVSFDLPDMPPEPRIDIPQNLEDMLEKQEAKKPQKRLELKPL